MATAVTDIILVKGIRCPAGYTLLANSPGGHNMSLTRGTFKADVFVCIKREDLSVCKTVISEIKVLLMGMEKVPAGYVVIGSKAGGRDVMIYVKKIRPEEATQYISDVVCCIPAKRDIKTDYTLIGKAIGAENVCVAYRAVKINHSSETQVSPSPVTPSPVTLSRGMTPLSPVLPSHSQSYQGNLPTQQGIYPDLRHSGSVYGGMAPSFQTGSNTMWVQPQLNDHITYSDLSQVPVDVVGKSTINLEAKPIHEKFKIKPKTLQEISQQYRYDFEVEKSVLTKASG